MSPSSEESNQDLLKLFNKSRIAGSLQDTILTCIYFPLGISLAIIRIFILFHIYILASVLPANAPVFRNAIRFMLLLCGISVRIESDEHRDDKCSVIVCNHISPVDRLVLYLVQPNIMANEWGLPPFLSWLFGMTDLNVENSRDTFLQNAKRLCQESELPMFTRPEGSPTSGKHALLKFSSWQFSICDTVQPVVLEAKRPMPINLTTLRSTSLSDLFYFIYTPYTLFSVRYLPVTTREDAEAVEDYAERVRTHMAASLSITASKFSRHDKNDLIKKLNYNNNMGCNNDSGNTVQSAPVRTQTTEATSQPLSRELEAMVQSCKAVVPQVPLHVLRKEIQKTQDVDTTLSNILEGNIDYQPEAEQADTQTQPLSCMSRTQATARNASQDASSSSKKSCGQLQTYKADTFDRRSEQRHMSLSERKHSMIREARLRYIEKHELSITIQQIESGRF